MAEVAQMAAVANQFQRQARRPDDALKRLGGDEWIVEGVDDQARHRDPPHRCQQAATFVIVVG
jgi:hypothetical protein